MGNKEREYEGEVVVEDDSSIEEPRLYHVIIHNDNYTTMEFVVSVLETVFHLPTPKAEKLMQDVHKKGKAIVGTYTFEIAETKANEAMVMARDEGHPLRCTVEPT